MAFDVIPFRRFGDLWDAFFEVPHIHFGGYNFGVPLELSETKDTVVNVKQDSSNKASYKNGVIRIEIPKTENKPIQIATS